MSLKFLVLQNYYLGYVYKLFCGLWNFCKTNFFFSKAQKFDILLLLCQSVQGPLQYSSQGPVRVMCACVKEALN